MLNWEEVNMRLPPAKGFRTLAKCFSGLEKELNIIEFILLDPSEHSFYKKDLVWCAIERCCGRFRLPQPLTPPLLSQERSESFQAYSSRQNLNTHYANQLSISLNLKFQQKRELKVMATEVIETSTFSNWDQPTLCHRIERASLLYN